MASKETTTKPYTPKAVDELLNELASFLYDAYQHDKEKRNDKIALEKGQTADNESESKKQ